MAPTQLRHNLLTRSALRAQPDQRLTTLVDEGSAAAIDEIVRRYRPALVRYAGSIVGPARAEDVVQDSLLRALSHMSGGRVGSQLRPWLYTVVRNAALNDLRDSPPPHQQLDESYDGVEQPPQALERRERVRSLVAGMRGLPDAQREALVKREMEGRSHTEIGDELGLSPGAARQLIFRARDTLRRGLGSLLPMPLLRALVEGGGGEAAVGATAATGATALVAKAAVAIVATGAVVGGAAAIRQADHDGRPAQAPVAGASSAAPGTGPGAGAAGTRLVADHGGDGSRRGRRGADGGGGDRHGGRGRADGDGRGGEDDKGSKGERGGGESRSGGRGSGGGEASRSGHGGGSVGGVEAKSGSHSGAGSGESGHGGSGSSSGGGSGDSGGSGTSGGSGGSSGSSGASVDSGSGSVEAATAPTSTSDSGSSGGSENLGGGSSGGEEISAGEGGGGTDS